MIQLGYWKLRGLVQRIKFLLAYFEVPYKDIHYDMDTRSCWFTKDKLDFLENKQSLANLPYLKTAQGKVIFQSDAIMNQICEMRNPGFLGRDQTQKVQIAQLKGFFKDLYKVYVRWAYNGPADAKQAIKQDIKGRLSKVEAFLGKKQFLAGQISVIDFYYFDFLNILTILYPGFVQGFAGLGEYYKRIASLPTIKKYMDNKQAFKAQPLNGPSAQFSPMPASTKPVLTLGYWKIRGLAQRIRMILEITHTSYQQIKYQDGDKWFKEDKPKLAQKNPFINLPYLIDGDKIISQSGAIIQYICLRAGRQDLLGDSVQTAMLKGYFDDAYSKFIQMCYGSKNFQKDKSDFQKQIELKYQKLGVMLGQKKWFQCNLTYIDLLVAQFVTILTKFSQKIKFPANISAHCDRVFNILELRIYRGSERFIERPINGASAHFK